MQIKFGTDGWRGLIARDYTFKNVARVTQAFCDVYKKDGFVYLGYDRRFLSREFAEEVAQVLTANGIEVRLPKQFCPTPCISWMTKKFDALAGIVITASHNPYQWNGIKFKEPGGGAASPDYTNPIEVRCQENLEQNRTPKKMPLHEARERNLLVEFDSLGPYLDQLKSMVDIEAIRRAGWNIIVDPMFGAGCGFFTAVLGDAIKELHNTANPSFGFVQPEPIAKNLPSLIEAVGHEGIDVGLATDGDADRIGAVDEDGRFIDSHHIFALIMRHLIKHRTWQGDAVTTVSTTQMIHRIGEKYGTTVHETPIGFKHICAKFREIDPLIGGEESGGIAIARHIPERDGILSGLLLLEIMTQEKKALSKIIRDLHDEVGPHHFRREDLELSEQTMTTIRNSLKDLSADRIAESNVQRVNRIDGCRFDLEDGSWVLIRPSGTEPLLRLYGEAESEERLNELFEAIHKLLPI